MDKTDQILTKQVAKNKTPAVQYVIFDRDTVIHKFQHGLADIKNNKTVDWNTTFNAFSATKTFTALAILQLAEKGKLSLDHSAKQYLPTFPYAPEITIRQLLTHTSGLPDPNPLSWIHRAEEHPTFDADAFFKGVFKKNAKLKSGPNEKFAYSNLGYYLLGQIIQKVSGQPYEDYIQDYVLRPLHLGTGELGFAVVDQDQHAKGYQKRYSLMNMLLGFFIRKSTFMAEAEGTFRPFKSYYVNGAAYGGLIGTAKAFVTYLQELLRPDGKLLSTEYKKMLFTENITNAQKATGMCLAWFRGELNGHEYFAHAGGGGGYYCELRIYPALGLGSILLYNRSGMSDARFLDKLDVYYISGK